MEICTVGGFEEVGKNMTALKIKEDVFLFDCGLYLPGVIELQEDPYKKYNEKTLRSVGGIPDDRVLDKLGWTKKVKAIFISHAHLDHVGGAPYLAHRYPQATIYATPFTLSVLNSLTKDEGIIIPNPLKKVDYQKKYSIQGADPSIKVEFTYTTHSTLDCSFISLHTPEGIFFYALDYKFDDTPTLGPLTDYNSLKRIGEEGVKVAIVNTLYSGKEEPNGSEKDADEMLNQAIKNAQQRKDSALFVTTFSSHIERLTNIIKHALRTNREIVLLGRSMAKYVNCAVEIGKWKYDKKVKVIKYRRQIDSFLRRVEKDRSRYFVICTGHQGEKDSILDRISNGETPFKFRKNDNLIFSSSIIPAEINIESRRILDKKLEKIGVELQKDVHVHGHGSQQTKIKLLEMIKPENLIPSHGNIAQEKELIEVGKKLGYELGKNSHLSKNGFLLNF
jgi:ribonuclease J